MSCSQVSLSVIVVSLPPAHQGGVRLWSPPQPSPVCHDSPAAHHQWFPPAYLRSWQSMGLHRIVVLTPVSVAPALLVISLVFPSALLQRWFISLRYKPPWTPAYYLPLWISWGWAWVRPFVESSESLIVWRGVDVFPTLDFPLHSPEPLSLPSLYICLYISLGVPAVNKPCFDFYWSCISEPWQDVYKV